MGRLYSSRLLSEPIVQLYHASVGTYLHGFSPDQGFALCLSFSPDGKTIATGGTDLIVLSDVATGREQCRLKMKQVLEVAFTPDGKTLISLGEDAKIRVWDLATRKERLILEKNGWIGRSMVLSADGTQVALGTTHNVVRVWDVATGKELSDQADGHDAPIRTVAFSPDGKRLLVTGGENQQIRIGGIRQVSRRSKGCSRVGVPKPGFVLARMGGGWWPPGRGETGRGSMGHLTGGRNCWKSRRKE